MAWQTSAFLPHGVDIAFIRGKGNAQQFCRDNQVTAGDIVADMETD